MLIGYARVSTNDQNLDLQTDALTRAGCERIFSDKASGAGVERDGLAEALKFMRAGDTLVVWKLDRLADVMLSLLSGRGGDPIQLLVQWCLAGVGTLVLIRASR